jgi:hypothetical protein
MDSVVGFLSTKYLYELVFFIFAVAASFYSSSTLRGKRPISRIASAREKRGFAGDVATALWIVSHSSSFQATPRFSQEFLGQSSG